MTAARIIPTRILAHASASALLGTRVYHQTAQQGESYPYVIYGSLDGEPTAHLGGHGGLLKETAQISVLAANQADILAARAIILAQFQGFRGSVSVGSDTYVIQSCFVHNLDERTAAPIPGQQFPVYGLTVELEIWSSLAIT